MILLGSFYLSSLSLQRINQKINNMKKNLRNVLALALGLITTVSFAQDWNVDSRTRIDMSDAMDKGGEQFMTDQRVTIGATWGGANWGIHVSSDVNYNLGTYPNALGARPSMSIYEAYASTDLMGMASLTIGRQALDYGSGALMSSNQWSANRTTWDGMSFGLGLSDLADITVGFANRNTGDTIAGGTALESDGKMYANIGGEFSGWNVNILYMTASGPVADASGASDNAAMGIDISGALMGASLSASFNTDHGSNEMRVLSLGYSVNDDLSVNVGQTAYSKDNEGNFRMAGTDMDGSWLTTGNVGYLASGMEDLHYGLSYSLGGISLSATMHNITNANEDVAGSTANADYERSIMELGVGYSLSNNANLGLKYATDDEGTEGSEATYTWITLTVTP